MNPFRRIALVLAQGMTTLMSRILRTIGAIMLVAAGISGCATAGNSWKEEVLLHDGRKIIVERSQRYGGRGEPGQSGPIKEHSISFKLPGSNQTIAWTSEYGEDLGRTNFILLAVHVLNETPYVIASPNLCLAYNKWGRPNPPYVAFKYEGNGWQRIALEALPTEFTTVNVSLGIQQFQANELSSAGLTSAEKIKAMNKLAQNPDFKRILREALPKGTVNSSVNCQELVYYKGMWVGPGDSIGKRMMDGKSK